MKFQDYLGKNTSLTEGTHSKIDSIGSSIIDMLSRSIKVTSNRSVLSSLINDLDPGYKRDLQDVNDKMIDTLDAFESLIGELERINESVPTLFKLSKKDKTFVKSLVSSQYKHNTDDFETAFEDAISKEFCLSYNTKKGVIKRGTETIGKVLSISDVENYENDEEIIKWEIMPIFNNELSRLSRGFPLTSQV